MFEEEETTKAELVSELKKGEKSGFAKNFNREPFLKTIHQKFLREMLASDRRCNWKINLRN
jgi:antitoxin ParD1/3/4